MGAINHHDRTVSLLVSGDSARQPGRAAALRCASSPTCRIAAMPLPRAWAFCWSALSSGGATALVCCATMTGGAWLSVAARCCAELLDRPRSVWQQTWSRRTFAGFADLRRPGRSRCFSSASLVWAIVRAYDPAANHTEQPMDLMFMNSIWVSADVPAAATPGWPAMPSATTISATGCWPCWRVCPANCPKSPTTWVRPVGLGCCWWGRLAWFIICWREGESCCVQRAA